MKPSFFYTDEFLNYDFSGAHPLKPIRLKLTYDAMKAADLLDDFEVTEPRKATDDELLQVHTLDYLAAVKQAEKGTPSFRYGLGTADNPLFPKIYSSSLVYSGASIHAAEDLFTRETSVNIAGGLHHAHPSLASGFCIFNDVALAISTLLKKYERVAYIDIDAHHADGVQEIFYTCENVLTISIHESGQFLFPGTGFPDEMGKGEGEGYNINIPVYPYTGDDVYIKTFKEVVPPLVEAYQPDVIVSQLGVDTNTIDPLTDLRLSIQGYLEVVKTIKALHHRHLVLGGGGYSLEVVPKAWSTAMAVFLGRDIESPCQPVCATPEIGRTYAQAVVNEIKKKIFPLFGLC